MSPFQYEELKSPTNEIRLIKLTPGLFEDDIKLQLFHAELNGRFEYRALSYTWDAPYEGLPADWDDPESKVPISINEQSFSLRKNLESALRHFQSGWKDGLVLWIDAISINQQDSKERSSAVLQMGRVYEMSQRTIVWLGPLHHLTQAGFSKLNALSEHWENQSSGCAHRPLDPKHVAEYENIVLMDFGEKDSIGQFEALAWVLDCVWWRRAWVMQEVVVAPSSMIICGNRGLKFATVENAFWQLSQHISSMPGAKLFDEGSEEQLILQHVQRRGRIASQFVRLLAAYRHKAEYPLGLLYFLSMLRLRSCSDPRDKIYAALSMTQEGRIISPDYVASPSQTYIHAAKQLINTIKNFNVLAYCEPSSADSDLPSWCPDWRKSTKPFRQPLFKKVLATRGSTHRHVYSASGNSSLTVEFENESRSLKIKGILIGSINFKGELTKFGYKAPKTWDDTDGSDLHYEREAFRATHTKSYLNDKVISCAWLHEWFNWLGSSKTNCVDLPDAASLPTIIPKEEPWTYSPRSGSDQFAQIYYRPSLLGGSLHTFRDTYWRVMCADVWITVAGAFGSRIQAGSDGDKFEPEKLLLAAGRSLPGRTFIATAGGLMGIGPEEVQIGDKIYVVLGSNVPFILRDQRNGTFTFVGECYVHGIMDGEVMKSGAFYHVDTIRIV
jgi:Heterokaryon incompatibility protein (HET)